MEDASGEAEVVGDSLSAGTEVASLDAEGDGVDSIPSMHRVRIGNVGPAVSDAETTGPWAIASERRSDTAVARRIQGSAVLRAWWSAPKSNRARVRGPLTFRVTHAEVLLAILDRLSGRYWGYVPPFTPRGKERAPSPSGDARIGFLTNTEAVDANTWR